MTITMTTRPQNTRSKQSVSKLPTPIQPPSVSGRLNFFLSISNRPPPQNKRQPQKSDRFEGGSKCFVCWALSTIRAITSAKALLVFPSVVWAELYKLPDPKGKNNASHLKTYLPKFKHLHLLQNLHPISPRHSGRQTTFINSEKN